jgi:hypothetical protein
MFKGRFLPLLILALNMAVLGGMFAIPGIAAEVPRIAKEELKSKLGTPPPWSSWMFPVLSNGRPVGEKSKVPFGRIQKMWNPGPTRIPKIRHWYSTEPDLTRLPVPVWHGNL